MTQTTETTLGPAEDIMDKPDKIRVEGLEFFYGDRTQPIEKVEQERSFLFVKWKKCYEKIQIKKLKTDKQRSNDLRKKLIHYLECKGIVITNPEGESLIKLIRQIGKYMAWKIE